MLVILVLILSWNGCHTCHKSSGLFISRWSKMAFHSSLFLWIVLSVGCLMSYIHFCACNRQGLGWPYNVSYKREHFWEWKGGAINNCARTTAWTRTVPGTPGSIVSHLGLRRIGLWILIWLTGQRFSNI